MSKIKENLPDQQLKDEIALMILNVEYSIANYKTIQSQIDDKPDKYKLSKFMAMCQVVQWCKLMLYGIYRISKVDQSKVESDLMLTALESLNEIMAQLKSKDIDTDKLIEKTLEVAHISQILQ